MFGSSSSSRGPKAVDKHVGARLRSAREEISETPETIAAAMGATIEDYGKIESGEQRPSPEALSLAAKFLKVNVAYFFADFSVPPPPAGAADSDNPMDPKKKSGGEA